MSKIYNKKTGRIGENLAAKFLLKKGFEILERNWGNKWGEVDITCRDHDVIVFVEVKTKVGIEFGMPEEMVGKRKLAQVERTASIYVPAQDKPKGIDVVAIVLSPDLAPSRITHYEAVY